MAEDLKRTISQLTETHEIYGDEVSPTVQSGRTWKVTFNTIVNWLFKTFGIISSVETFGELRLLQVRFRKGVFVTGEDELTGFFVHKTSGIVDNIDVFTASDGGVWVRSEIGKVYVDALNFKGNVPTYAGLGELVSLEINDSYSVDADGLVYVWNGTSFPPDGEGLDLSVKPNGIVEENNLNAVSGGEVNEKVLIKKDFNYLSTYTYIDFESYIKEGYVLDSEGAVFPYAGFNTVSFLKLPFCTNIHLNGNTDSVDSKYICFYDSNKNVLKIINVVSGLQSVDVPENSYYLSFTLKMPSEAVNPNVTLKINNNNINYILGFKEQEIASYDRFIINKTPYLINNAGFNSTGGLSPASGYYCVDMIPKFGSTNVIIENMRKSEEKSKFFVQKDKKNTVIKVDEIFNIPFEVELLSNCEFYGFTLQDPYEVDLYSLENSVFSVIDETASILEFKQLLKNNNIVDFSDSISWYDGKPFGGETKEGGDIAIGFASYYRYFLGANVDNQGRSGWDITQILNVVKTYDYTNTDIVTLRSGANDHRKGIALGTLEPIGSVFDVNTYIGAMQESVEHMLSEKENVKIILISPLKGWFTENLTPDVPNLYKGEYEISVDFVNATKEVAELYSLPFIDIYHNSRTNYITKNIYITDPDVTPYFLHPSNLGFKRICNYMLKYIQ